MKVIIFCLIFFCSISVIAQDTTSGKVKFATLKGVVRIDIPQKGFGTGFIVAITDGVHLNTPTRVFIITNKHMVGDWNLADQDIEHYYPSLVFNFYSKLQSNGNLFLQKEFQLLNKDGSLSKNVKTHSNPVVDIAAIDITSIINDAGIDMNDFDTSYLQSFSAMNGDLEVGVGDQLFAVGYPAGITSLKTNYPIAKVCYVSSVIEQNFEVNTTAFNRNKILINTKISGKFFLVDGLIIEGNSGSPIVIPATTYYKKIKGVLSSRELPNLIVGIQSSNLGNTGISVIYSAEYIKELIASF